MYRCVRLKGGFLLAVLCMAALSLPFVLWGSVPAQSVMAGSPVVYLTFDDGPSEATPALLQALDEVGVKASFFVTAQNPDCFGYAAQAHEAGHLLCAHTASHDFAKIYAGESAFWQDIDEVNDMIAAITGAPANILRFAGGSSNTLARRYGGSGLMRALTEGCGERGFVYVDWNVDTGDGVEALSAETIAKRAVKGVAGKPHAVILMHDGTSKNSAADAVRILVPQLREMGCSFATLDALPVEVHHTLP